MANLDVYGSSGHSFAPDLATFQAGLKVPLITHARWIDAASPYRSQYTISGNVATDPQYWEDIGELPEGVEHDCCTSRTGWAKNAQSNSRSI